MLEDVLSGQFCEGNLVVVEIEGDDDVSGVY
jgi:hypothetical protein